MTSDEAVKILVSHWSPCTDALGLVMALESLGAIKIDRPRSGYDKAVDALFTTARGGMITPRQAIDAISAAGLQIIEKGQ